MEEHKNKKKQNLNLIQDLFVCEPVLETEDPFSTDACKTVMEEIMAPDQEQLDFLDERERLREQLNQNLDITSYLRSYDKLCRYGLDEYFMELLKWEINMKTGGDPDTFFSQEFELRYKDQEYMLDLIKNLED